MLRLTGVVEDEHHCILTFLPSSWSVIPSALPAQAGQGAPESVSCPGMPFFIQFMGQGALGIPEVWFEVGEGEWRWSSSPPGCTLLRLKVLSLGPVMVACLLLSQVGEGRVGEAQRCSDMKRL